MHFSVWSCYRVLLDELLQYEPISGQDEEVTDDSGEESIPAFKPASLKQVYPIPFKDEQACLLILAKSWGV